jgi:hypothetical protein
MTMSSLRWPLLALLGLLVAAAIAFLATQMVSQKIGISSEPLSAGRALAPRSPAARKPPLVRTTTVTTPASTGTSASVPAPVPAPVPESPSAPSDQGGDQGGEGGDD